MQSKICVFCYDENNTVAAYITVRSMDLDRTKRPLREWPSCKKHAIKYLDDNLD